MGEERAAAPKRSSGARARRRRHNMMAAEPTEGRIARSTHDRLRRSQEQQSDDCEWQRSAATSQRSEARIGDGDTNTRQRVAHARGDEARRSQPRQTRPILPPPRRAAARRGGERPVQIQPGLTAGARGSRRPSNPAEAGTRSAAVRRCADANQLPRASLARGGGSDQRPRRCSLAQAEAERRRIHRWQPQVAGELPFRRKSVSRVGS